MPRKKDKKQKVQKPKLPAHADRRRKLSDEQKEEIFAKYAAGNTTQMQLAQEYGVSRRTISFIVNPEAIEQYKASRKARGGWRRYYDKDKSREALKKTQEHRANILGEDDDNQETDS